MTEQNNAAVLMLEDGSRFEGRSCGADGEVFGEVCFNTSMVGYLEILSDASYAGEIVALTYPQIGNYGVNRGDLQRTQVHMAGLVVHEMCAAPSNYRSQLSLPDFLREQGVVAIEGIDTRALVEHIRTAGAMRAVISTQDQDGERLLGKVRRSPGLSSRNWVEAVSVREPSAYVVPDTYAEFLKPPQAPQYKVAVVDCGVKAGILRNLAYAGCAVQVLPWDTPAADILALAPDGVFFSNGPGDPEQVQATYQTAAALLGKLPVFGICLGHQMLALAAGARVEKLKFGHHGGNQPVMNLLTNKVEITAQNHNFSILFDSLGTPLDESGRIVRNDRFGRIQLTHVNLNDGTPEGIRFLDIPAFSVQYHPEASPGPTDSHYLFTAFTRMMAGQPDYLDIDISADRLGEWK